ncbi:20772_t:CDS:2 [Dentiscutata erythropus]|uniref:20772_t:CDS:1 n=1 Tax=Dentiscutata erythropus TaxID=1348616 RepID=A0A9N8VM50_9GLOM|nr:20772_t:CDS:2 [Dentiscutata erythropus]
MTTETIHGVAKLANIINVRIFDKDRYAEDSAILKGVNYVINAHKNDIKKNSIINMSFGGPYSETIAKLVKKCTNNGIHVVATAGNDYSDTCSVIPAAAPSAITVAASDKLDQIANFSNYESCIDIYAPGNNNNSIIFNGTSISALYVVGTVALYISTYSNLHPSNMFEAIISLATKNIITGISSRNDTYFMRAIFGNLLLTESGMLLDELGVL